MHKGVTGFLQKLAAIPGVEEVALTTNGLLLVDNVQALKGAGVKRLNISIDSLQAKTYAEITCGGDLETALAGLTAAEAIGMDIKLNMVIMRSVNNKEIPPLPH